MRRPSRLGTAIATAVIAVPLIAGCEAKVYGTPPDAAAPQLTVVAPMGTKAPLPETPPDQPAAAFTGLSARAQQATADASKAERRELRYELQTLQRLLRMRN